MKKRTYTKYEWKERVSAEFEMPVRELVELFISDKYSMAMTAKTIGIDVDTLKRFCVPRGIKFPDRMDLRPDCKPKSHKKGRINNPWGSKGKPKSKIKERNN